MPTEHRWWRLPGLWLTAALFVFCGLALLEADSPNVDWASPWLSLLAGVLIAAFAVRPCKVWLFRASGLAGFAFLTSQCARILSRVFLDGWDGRDDWIRLFYVGLFAYFSLLFAVLWLTQVKPWHTLMWARRRVKKERR